MANHQGNNEEELNITYNPGFVMGKLMQAAKNQNSKHLQKWQNFMQSSGEGKLSVGSRQPVKDTPSWVTLEVAAGGFATGAFMAGGPLQDHETEYYKYFFDAKPESEEQCREKLNNEFLSGRGFEYLSHLLETSQYEVKVPEEGALLAVVWLCSIGQEKRAKELKDVIAPWFAKLRFYPIPSLTPLTMGAEVSVASVSEVINSLADVSTPQLMLLNRSVIDEVLPAYDALILAVLGTSKGERTPEVVDGKVVGDLPFEVDDKERRGAVIRALATLDNLPERLQKTQRFRVGHLGVLIKIVRKFVAGKHTPFNAEVARKIIAQVNQRRGIPGTTRGQELRAKQRKSVERVGVADEMSKMLIKRLTPKTTNKSGLKNISKILQPVKKNEAVPPILTEGLEISESLAAKVRRAKLGTIEELCEEGLVPSEEVLANLCPALVANVLSKGISDRPLAALYGAIYQAFKNRRSLLLLNLEKQVSINELPWFVELEKQKPKQDKESLAGAGTKATLEDLVMLALKIWPETMMPNKFIGVLYDLSLSCFKEGTRGIPFMKELASDIFMGQFSQTFLTNAKLAAEMMKGTLYESYYDLDYNTIGKFEKELELEQYCGAKRGNWGNVTENGVAIERCMIVTTHNLALAFARLNVRDKLQGLLPTLARKIFNFIIRETHLLATINDWKARLQMLKNAAYAFRQMVFFLSFASKEDQAAFFEWAFARCDKIKDEDYKTRLLLPVKSLHATFKGETERNKTIFTGWVATGRHFLMPPKK